jgi:X-Pro dipeptidyl-peptidase
VYASLDAGDEDATGNFTTPFWSDRNYVDDAANVKASVFLVHGMNDENVRFDHFSRFWFALGGLGVPRKAWIMQSGHIDPFDLDRATWVRTAHHWFDYWLQGVQNGVMSEPPVRVETGPATWEDQPSWPVPGSTPTQIFLKPGPNAGTLGLAPEPGAEPTTTFTDSANQSENTMLNNPTTVTANRRMFLSPVLTAPVRISGTPIVQLDASANKTSTHFGAILVDYGPAVPRVSRSGDGATTLTTTDCWGESSADDSACYKQVAERLEPNTTTRWRVTKGILDAGHRTDRRTTTPIVADQRYPFSFPMLPYEYTFQPGHQIAVVIVGSYSGYGSTSSNTGAAITLSLQKSRVVLPIVGGGEAAKAAGISAGAPTTTTLADAPNEITATVTGDDAALTGQPLPPDGAFSLPDPLQVSITPAAWTAPVSHASVAIGFSQHIGSTDALRTGSYTKTLTFTLSTTTP